MKKFLLLIACICTLFVFNVEGATVYMFRGAGCSHCHEAIEYFYNYVESNPEMIEKVDFKIFEVWYDENNNELFEDVLTKIEGTNQSGVPYIVIGNSYHNAGFAEQLQDTIINAALSESENPEYEDVVGKILESHPNASFETLDEAAASEGIIELPDSYVTSNLEEENDDDFYAAVPSEALDTKDAQENFSNAIHSSLFMIIASVLAIINVGLLIALIIFIVLYTKEKNKNKKNIL